MDERWLYEVVGDDEYIRLRKNGRLHIWDGDVYEASWDLTPEQACELAKALVRWADGQ